MHSGVGLDSTQFEGWLKYSVRAFVGLPPLETSEVVPDLTPDSNVVSPSHVSAVPP